MSKKLIEEFISGIKDSCDYYHAVRVLWKCRNTHRPLILSVWITGGVFLGSVLAHSWVIDPLLKGYPKLDKIFTMLYYVLWLFPVYMFSFILNIFCYSDIANGVYQQVGGRIKSPSISLSRSIAYFIHRSIIMGVYLVLLTILSFFPYSQLLIISLISWLYSFYCFEYRWVLEGKTFHKEIQSLEHNALYYLGFGMPFTLITCYFPVLLGNGIWALVFPLFMVTSILSNPPGTPTLSIPVFQHISSIGDKIEVLILGN